MIDNVRGDALYTFSIAERGRTGALFFLGGPYAREYGFDLTESNCRDMARELAGTHVSVDNAAIQLRIPTEWDVIGPVPTHTLAVNLRNDSMFELSDIRVQVRLFGTNGKAFDAQEIAVAGSVPAGTATDLIGLRMGVGT